ncbi:MAG: glutathione peroxidase [Candidatus Firestonebacteria bacterium GWA2_43_8]|nr:MAG: glutathione peroxidase [Candidatus Firestonebacteria bacterium GWA2_43_8]
MSKFLKITMILFFIITVSPEILTGGTPMTNQTIFDLVMKDIDGKDTGLETFKGKVILIVNVASKCGFTPQYKGLESIYEKYKDKGFVILGFPANDFLWQEPGTNEEIKQFCLLKYNVTFPMFAKISVKGKEQSPLYKYLTEKETNPDFSGPIKWNFTKFLIDRKGNIAARFEPKVTPESDEVVKKIEEELGKQ